jgi:hypothetical protein
MSALTDIWNNINGILHSADTITLVIMAVIVLGAGFLMEELGSIVTVTVGALIVFALAGFVRAVAMNGANAAQLAQSDWHDFLAWQVQGLVAYAVLFAVAIAVIQLIRSLVMR